jgi:hypothetical protein
MKKTTNLLCFWGFCSDSAPILLFLLFLLFFYQILQNSAKAECVTTKSSPCLKLDIASTLHLQTFCATKQFVDEVSEK